MIHCNPLLMRTNDVEMSHDFELEAVHACETTEFKGMSYAQSRYELLYITLASYACHALIL